MIAGENSHRAVVVLLLAVMALGVGMFASDALATGVAHNVPQGADIVMKELRWPAWDQGTYFCFWYVSFHPDPYGTFYGGLVTKGPTNPPGMFMSYWGSITNIHEGKFFYRHGYGAEGAKGGANGRALFMHANSWYRMVLRIFPPSKDADKQTYVGWWVKDVDRGLWYTHSVVRIDTRATGVKGNSGFVEALAPDSVHRAFERRRGYCRLNGKWHKSNVLLQPNSKYFKLINNGTVLRYDRSGRDSAGKTDDPKLLARQPDRPTLDKPAIEKAKATSCNNQVAVRWSIPQKASPQLGYKLEVFAGASAKGTPLATCRDNSPHILAKRLDVARSARSVRLTVTDIFDQTVSTVIPVEPVVPAGASKVAKVRPGLKYAFYEAPKGVLWEKLPRFQAIEPTRQGVVKVLDDTIRESRSKLYAIRYKGFLRAPATGLYVLELGTCDGSRLLIDGRMVADNDGIHGTSVAQYPLALAAGLHSFELSYFKGSKSYLADKILARWEGPGFQPRKLTGDDFVNDDRARIPTITMPADGALSKGVLSDNLVTIRPRIQDRGHKIAKVQYYRDRLLLATVERSATAGADDMVFRNLLPAGKNRIWARLWYDDHCSVDSNVITLTAKNRTEGKWTYDTLGESMFPLAVRSKDGTVSFRGDGFCFGHQKIQGDFTLTARVSDIAMTTPANCVHRSNWLGLYVQQDLRRPFGGNRFGIYCTAGVGVRGAADYPDLAGSYMSIPSFPKDHRWLRLVRRGSRLLAYTSADGKTWHKAIERIAPKMKKDIYAGVLFRSVPGKSRTLFYGSFDNVTLTSDVPKEPRLPAGREDLPRKGQVLALVQAKPAPATLYARTLGKGLLKSIDAGKRWQSVDANAKTPDTLAVRSVAVHPKDSSIVLRGSGSIAGGKLQSNLLRSTDGGKTWTSVSKEIDFDGRGPTAMFGEVIAFAPERPDYVAAAGETSGLFLSRDAGVTWKPVGLAGHRVTCLAFVPADKKLTLVVGTIADSEFETLKLPKPYSSVKSPGAIYWCEFRDDKPLVRPSFELADFGVTNIGFGAHPNFATFATTRGVFYTWQHGNVFSQRRNQMPADSLFTALGYRQFMKEWLKNDWRLRSTTYAAPFSGDRKSPVYCVPERTKGVWSLLSKNAAVQGDDAALNSGVTCLLADQKNANVLYLCNRHGVFKSTDRGKSYARVYQP